MIKKRPSAFTLVELIVVITILAVLSTIAFISFQGYAVNSRDSVRLADMNNISKGLNIKIVKAEKLPIPDDKIDITASGTILTYQGYAGQQTLGNIEVHGGGKDPLDQTYYHYSTNLNRNKFQLLGFFENSDNISYFSNNTFANLEDRYPKIKGHKLGIIVSSNTNEPLEKTIVGNTFNLYTTDNNHKVVFGNEQDEQIIFTDSNRQKLAYYNSRSCKALYEFGSYNGNKVYTIYSDGIPLEAYCDMTQGGIETRNFRTFDGVDDFIEIPELTASGDFEVSAQFTKNIPNNKVLFGDNHYNSLYFNVSDTLSVHIAGNGYNFGDFGGFIDGKLHTVNYKLIGNNLTVTLDGISVTKVVIPYTGRNTFRIGSANSNTSSWDGIIANLHFKSGWSQNGIAEANPYYRLDEVGDIVHNSNTEIGNELWVNSNTTLASPWVDNSDGFYSIDGSHSTSTVVVQEITEKYKTYIVNFSLSNYITGILTPTVGSDDASFGMQESGNGSYSQIITKDPAAGVNKSQMRALPGFIGTISGISVKEAPGYGVYKNFSDSSVEKFIEDDDGNWLGEELIMNGGFEDTSQWDLKDTWLIGQGIAYTSDTTTINARLTYPVGTENNIYKVEYQILSPMLGRIQVYIGLEGSGLIRTQPGIYSENITAGHGGRFILFGLRGFHGSVDNISMKRFLQLQ